MTHHTNSPRNSVLAARPPALVLALALALVGGLALASPDGAEDTRAPVPERGAQTPAISALKKEFRAELKSKEADDKRALAETLLARAADDKDAVRRYVLLDQAAALAEDAQDVTLTLAAVDAIAAQFQIERTARAFAAVNGIGRSSKDVGTLAVASTTCIDLTGDAVAGNDQVLAGKAVLAAKGFAKKAEMDGIEARAGELAKLVSAFARSKTAFAAVEQALTENPADEAAHTAAGRFRLGTGDVGRALVHFLGCDDATLKALAVTEGEIEQTPERRSAAADAWWAAAEAEKDVLVAARMRAHAAQYYRLVLSSEIPHDAAVVQARLDEVTYTAWGDGVALTTDFSRFGPADLALAKLRDFIAEQEIDKSKDDWRTRLPLFPDIDYAPGVDYYWHLETSQGDITIRFFADSAPRHVTNFLYLTELGFFDGLTFHRVIPGFMAQGGDPTGNGSGGPGYFIDSEFDGAPKHDEPGVLSMANTGRPKSDGSQFFITFRPCPELNGKHTVFGKVTEGMKTVKKLEAEGTPGGPPKTPLVIEHATVFMK